ncbi:MAG: curli assembly protein CsgG [Leptospiraceae bacterium]|nr:curli assembly protein CsgG [Leptospiraceae bacterium]MCZ8346284.1 curli assembly protein CsgG [Leptospiraceae bacterium]
MKHFIYSFIFIFLFLFSNCTTITTVRSNSKVPGINKIAVLNFEMNGASWGPEFSDAFIHHILKNSSIEVIEREQIFKILDEQRLSKTGIIDESTSAKIGRILGVDAIVVGRGTALSFTDSVGIKRGSLVDTFSLKLITVQSGSIAMQSRKSPGTDWTWKRIAKYTLGLGLIWSREDMFVESCGYDEVASRMAELVVASLIKPEKEK